MVANTVEEFNPRDFSTCSTPRYVICVGVTYGIFLLCFIEIVDVESFEA